MRTIIAGSRHLWIDVDTIDIIVNSFQLHISKIVSGHSGNVDLAAESWAKREGIPCELYPADWKQFGRRAGPLRNGTMVKNADALIAVHDGISRGTADVIRQAREAGLKVFVWTH